MGRGGIPILTFHPRFNPYGPAMKRFAPFRLLGGMLLCILVPLALAAGASSPNPSRADKSPVAPVATAISTVTGIAISPLLGTGAYGAYQWTMAKDDAARAALPWYAQWSFFGPALLIVGACAAKDAFATVLPPGFKKPLDVLEVLESKATGLIAAGAVVPLTVSALSKVILGGKTAAAEPATVSHGLATIQVANIDWASVLNVLTVPFGIAIFAFVWMASHAINVLILLSPWGAIDVALKVGRTALLGLLTVSAILNPWVGAALSLVVIVFAYFLAGWAFRLTVFGTVFSWDFFTLRNRRFKPAENDNPMFAGPNLPGVPPRTYGRLVQRTESNELEFFHRPWLVLSVRAAKVPTETLTVGKGFFFSNIASESGKTFFLLPPCYRGHEEELVRIHQFAGGVHPAGLRRAWSVIRELFGGAAAKNQMV